MAFSTEYKRLVEKADALRKKEIEEPLLEQIKQLEFLICVMHTTHRIPESCQKQIDEIVDRRTV